MVIWIFSPECLRGSDAGIDIAGDSPGNAATPGSWKLACIVASRGYPGQDYCKQVELRSVILVVQAPTVALQPSRRAGQQRTGLHRERMHLVKTGFCQATQVEAEAALARDVGKVAEPRRDVLADQHLVVARGRIDQQVTRNLVVHPIAEASIAERICRSQRHRIQRVQPFRERGGAAGYRSDHRAPFARAFRRLEFLTEGSQSRLRKMRDIAPEQ